MSRDYYLIRDGREVVVEGGMYDADEAQRVAQNAARREPGVRYSVLTVLAHFEFEAKPTEPDRA